MKGQKQIMEKFYITLRQVKGMDIDLSQKEDIKKFCSILQDLASEYKPECNWLKRVMEKEMHLQFLGKKDAKLSEKKQIIGRVKNQLETEEGFAEKAIQKIIMSFMILGDWQESYDEIMNGEKSSQNTKKTQGATSKNTANNMSSSPYRYSKASLNGHRDITLSVPTASEVVKVHVAVGKLVSRGDIILTVKTEPSKMIMDIVASQSGRIVTIAGVGEKVKGGDTLAVIMEFEQAKKSKNASQNTSYSNHSANTQNKNQTTSQSSASAQSGVNSTPKGNSNNDTVDQKREKSQNTSTSSDNAQAKSSLKNVQQIRLLNNPIGFLSVGVISFVFCFIWSIIIHYTYLYDNDIFSVDNIVTVGTIAGVMIIILAILEKGKGNMTRAAAWGIILVETMCTLVMAWLAYDTRGVISVIVMIVAIVVFRTFYKNEDEVGFNKGKILGISIWISLLMLVVLIGISL